MTSRRVFLALSGTGALALLPKTWTKPVVDAVIVPAHAQASPGVTTTTAPPTTAPPTTTLIP